MIKVFGKVKKTPALVQKLLPRVSADPTPELDVDKVIEAFADDLKEDEIGSDKPNMGGDGFNETEADAAFERFLNRKVETDPKTGDLRLAPKPEIEDLPTPPDVPRGVLSIPMGSVDSVDRIGKLASDAILDTVNGPGSMERAEAAGILTRVETPEPVEKPAGFDLSDADEISVGSEVSVMWSDDNVVGKVLELDDGLALVELPDGKQETFEVGELIKTKR